LYARGTKLLNYEERKATFQKAVDLCPSYAEAHVNLADAYENLADFDNAERHYREALRINENFTTPCIGLGEVYLKTGRYRLAAEAFGRGLGISPDNERLQAGLKVASERLKREKGFYESAQIFACLTEDEEFRLMCMCPGDYYSSLKKWICIPPIFFGSGSWSLTPDTRRQLDEIGKALKTKELSGKKWLITGHADIVGTSERNLLISENRARAVKDYLAQAFGMDPKSFNTRSFGHNRPRATNSTLEGRSDNRRAEIVLDE
jgi:outer membrane protein OmpA-like peptidoglycan-associated protein